MRWLATLLILCSMSMVAHTKELSNTSTILLAHTGEQCQTIKTLKKTHPTQRIYWETINKKKCYHLHDQRDQASISKNGWNVKEIKPINNNILMSQWMTPTMRAFYDDYTSGRADRRSSAF